MFYVLNIQGTAQSIFKYETQEEAKSVYHQTLASNYATYNEGKLAKFSVVLMNEYGDVIMREFQTKQTAE